MPELTKVAQISDIPAGESIAVQCGRERVAVFNIDGAYYAVSDMCPHAGGPLSQGYVKGTRVTCPWHGWQFDLCPAGEAPNDGICRFPVHVQGDDIFIEV